MNRLIAPLSVALFFVGCNKSPQSPALTSAANSTSLEVKPREPSVEHPPAVEAGRPLQLLQGQFLLSDFELEGLEHRLGGVWTTSSDPHGLGTTLSPNPLVRNEGGADGSAFSLRIAGHFGRNVKPWPYADVRASFDATDMSQVARVQFWARGNGKRYILALVRRSVVDFSHYRAEFTAPEEWTLVELPLSEFQQPDWGRTMQPDWRDVTALSFQPSASLNDEPYDLALDEVILIGE